MEIGLNAPPMHPNCRSTTQLVLNDNPVKHEEKLIENPKINEKRSKGVIIRKKLKNFKKYLTNL